MINYAKIEESLVQGIYIFETETIIAEDLGTFVDVTSRPEVQVGWAYDAETDTFTFVEVEPEKRLYLSQAEWIGTFTPTEWEDSQNGSVVKGYIINEEEVTDSVRQQWRQYLDVISSVISETKVVDLQSKVVNDYYTFLVENGYITEERKNELLEGILD